MSGAGFLCATTSPANTMNCLACPAPTARSRVAATDSRAEVEATASRQPASSACAATRAMPGRGGTAPAVTSPV